MQDSGVVNDFAAVPGQWRERVTPRVMWGVLAVLSAASWLVFASRPFIIDLPLMHYVAWRVNAGDAPYVDVWDMNGPVVYMLHQAALMSPLSPALTMAALMTLMTAGCVAGAAMIASRGGRHWLGLAAGVAMLGLIVARDTEYLMQRDTLIGALALGALVLVSRPGGGVRRWTAAGVAIALAVGVKPTAAPFAVAAFAAAVWIDLGEGRRFARALWLVAGGIAGAMVWLVWLAVTDGLAGFWHVMTAYNVAYSQIARMPLMALLREPMVFVTTAAMLGCVAALNARARDSAGREALAMLGLAGAFAGIAAAVYVIQGKGWPYQSAPATIVGVAAAAMALSHVKDFSARGRVYAVAAGVGVCVIAALAGVGNMMSARYQQAQQDRATIVEDMVADLGKLPGGIAVQPLDTIDGAVNAMTRTARVPASPVMYDFWLFEGDAGAIAAARAAVLGAMRGEAPPAILMTRQGWPHEGAGYERMTTFAEFTALLDAHYTLVGEGRRGAHGYRLYAPS